MAKKKKMENTYIPHGWWAYIVTTNTRSHRDEKPFNRLIVGKKELTIQ